MITPAEIFSALVVLGAALAVFLSDARKVVLCSWLAGMSMGALFLSCGAEYLAVIQWIVSTLVAIVFLVFATMYGEYGVLESRTAKEKVFDALPALLVGLSFFVMIVFVANPHPFSLPQTMGPAQPNDLGGVGSALGDRHLLALELTALTFLAAVVGAGVLSRAQNDGDKEAR